MYSVCFGVSIALLFLIVFSKKRVSELGLLLLIITKLQHYTEWLTNYEYYCNWNTWIIIPPCQCHCGHHFPHPPAPSPPPPPHHQTTHHLTNKSEKVLETMVKHNTFSLSMSIFTDSILRFTDLSFSVQSFLYIVALLK